MLILITGANGFIGSELCRRLALHDKVLGVDVLGQKDKTLDIDWEKADITDCDSVSMICERYVPDVIIHCAGIAHQKFGTVNADTYMRVNKAATETLARAAAKCNPDVRFIFLSSISVYGEESLSQPVAEESPCRPSSDYAQSKLAGEQCLLKLYEQEILRRLFILRLAPVYDRTWSFNLERRVFMPKRIAYLKFGPGTQKLSAVARPNVLDFIVHILLISKRPEQKSAADKNKNEYFCEIFNVCDTMPYSFNEIISVFRKSRIFPKRLLIRMPFAVVRFLTSLGGCLFFRRKSWLNSCYNKLAEDLVFDNEKMLQTGFLPKHSLQEIYTS